MKGEKRYKKRDDVGNRETMGVSCKLFFIFLREKHSFLHDTTERHSNVPFPYDFDIKKTKSLSIHRVSNSLSLSSISFSSSKSYVRPFVILTSQSFLIFTVKRHTKHTSVKGKKKLIGYGTSRVTSNSIKSFAM